MFVCDECIELCNDIIREEIQSGVPGKADKNDLPVPHEIRARLDEYVIGQEQGKTPHPRRWGVLPCGGEFFGFLLRHVFLCSAIILDFGA